MKTESAELALAPAEETPTHSNPSTGQLLAKVIDSGINKENVDVLERLIAMREREEARQAEKDFAKAFVALQAEMPRIVADKKVPDREGNLKYKFAPYETIMDAVQPLLLKHGFTVTFSMTFSDGRVIQTCTLQHIGGHSKSNQFACRVGQGPPKSSEAQGDGAASTYAKRFALCNALNITIESDTDAQLDVKLEGDVISPEQIAYLKETVKDTGFNEAAFWVMAGVETGSYEKIRQGSYPVLSRALEMRRNAPKKS